MPEIHHIKHLREKKGLSLSETVRRHANVNKYGEVTVDGEAFVVHGIPVPNRVLVKKEWDRFMVLSQEGEVYLEAPRPYTKKQRELPWKDILAEWAQKHLFACKKHNVKVR